MKWNKNDDADYEAMKTAYAVARRVFLISLVVSAGAHTI